MIYLGIDPGFEGAVAAIDNGVVVNGAVVYDTPILVLGKGKKEKPVFDASEMHRLLGVLTVTRTDVFVGIEEVGPRPMEGVVSVFRFGTGYGIWLGLIAAAKLPYVTIPPAVWKRAMFGTRGMDKDASVILAEQKFPLHSFRTPRGRLLDGRAEALLIADYVRQQHLQGKL